MRGDRVRWWRWCIFTATLIVGVSGLSIWALPAAAQPSAPAWMYMEQGNLTAWGLNVTMGTADAYVASGYRSDEDAGGRFYDATSGNYDAVFAGYDVSSCGMYLPAMLTENAYLGMSICQPGVQPSGDNSYYIESDGSWFYYGFNGTVEYNDSQWCEDTGCTSDPPANQGLSRLDIGGSTTVSDSQDAWMGNLQANGSLYITDPRWKTSVDASWPNGWDWWNESMGAYASQGCGTQPCPYYQGHAWPGSTLDEWNGTY